MKAEQRGRRLATLRRLLALNQTEFSELTGLSQPLISLMERGERSVTDAVVLELARLTQTPTSFFEVPDEQRSGMLSFRKLATTSASSRDAAIARFEELERVATDLCQRVDYPRPALPQAEDDIDGDDIENLAQNTRERLRLEVQDPILNLTRAFERRGIIVAAMASIDDGILEGHDGASRAAKALDRPVIGYVSGMSGDRERFTKAHELGHIVLHAHRPDVGTKIREREAHRFAGALLIPEAAMRDEVSETLSLNGYLALKATWGVSIQAIIARGYALGLLSDARRKALIMQVSYRGWRKNEPVEVKPESPLLLRQLLVKQYGKSPYLRASTDLGIAPCFLQDWAPGANAGPSEAAQLREVDAPTNVIRLFS